MSERLELTAIYEPVEDGWVMARVREIPEIVTQGATQEEARQMVLSAVRDWIALYVTPDTPQGDGSSVPEGAHSESLELTIA